MKKLILTIFLAVLFTSKIFASSTIPVYYNSKPIPLSTNPIVKETVLFVPYREVFEHMGYTIEWDAEINSSIGYNEQNQFTLQVGNDSVYINGAYYTLPVQPQLINGTTMVPISFISQVSGYELTWNNDNRYLTIGEINESLINVYEQTSILSNDKFGIIRGQDLYYVPGTGAYIGYNKLMGHPYEGYDAYFKTDGDILHLTTNRPAYNGNELINWTVDGINITNTKSDVYWYLDTLLQEGLLDSYTGQKIIDSFGDVYIEWVTDKANEYALNTLTEDYVEFLDGSRLELFYNRYSTERRFEQASIILAAETERIEEEREQKAADDHAAFEEYRNKLEELKHTPFDGWISGDALEYHYNFDVIEGAVTIWIKYPVADNMETYTIPITPSKLEVDKVYKDNNVRYKYVEYYTVPFPEAKDGSGEHTIYLDNIVFNIDDLIKQGILDKKILD